MDFSSLDFYSITLIVAVILLIASLTFIGIIMSGQTAESSNSACPNNGVLNANLCNSY